MTPMNNQLALKVHSRSNRRDKSAYDNSDLAGLNVTKGKSKGDVQDNSGSPGYERFDSQHT